MKPRIDPARLETFGEAYVGAILRAVRDLASWTGELSPEDYAVAMTVEMLAAVKRAGIPGIAHYYLNSKGRALQYACEELGLEPSTRALELYLEGR